MESEIDTVRPKTPSYRHYSRSCSPPRRFQVGYETVTAFDDSNTVEPESVLPFDELNTVVPEMDMSFDKSFSVVPEMVLPFDDSNMVVPEMVFPFDDSESKAVVPRSQPRIVRPKSDDVILQFLAICCPAVLTIL